MPGFTFRYRCRMLVWFELHADMFAAIAREKRIKGGLRARTIGLIEAGNPHWHDRYDASSGPRWIASPRGSQ